LFIELDTHFHSVASTHGYSTVKEIAQSAAEKGLKGFALTDHGPASPDSPHVWHFRNLQVIPDYICGVRVIKGAEVNIIDYEGNIDMSDFDLKFYSREKDQATGIVPFEQMSDILDFCRDYADEFTPSSKGIFMEGPTGLGKTHLSLSIASKVIEKGYTVVYGTAYDLLRQVEEENFGRTENKDTLNNILDADLLILDDLGAEFNSPFNLSAVYNIIDTRCNRGKATIISSNLNLAELEERYSRRLVSRLISLFTYLRFIGRDVRQLKSR